EVEEHQLPFVALALTRAEGLHQLVAWAAHSEGAILLRRIAAVPLEEKRALGPLLCCAGEQRRQVSTIDLDRCRRRGTESGSASVENIDGGGGVRNSARSELARPAHETWHMDAALEDAALQPAQPGVIALLLRAVIRHEDDDRLAGHLLLVEQLEQ